jgi:hypothetical protein
VFSIAVGTGDWIASKAAGDGQDGTDLETSKSAHERAGIGVCCSVLRVVEVGADEPESAERETMPLILQGQRTLPIESEWILRLLCVGGCVVDCFGEGVSGEDLEVVGELAIEGDGCPVICGARGGEEIDGVEARIISQRREDEAIELLWLRSADA